MLLHCKARSSKLLFVRMGHGGNGFIRVVGKSALESGGLFALLMGVGGLIRCDELLVSPSDRLSPLTLTDKNRHDSPCLVKPLHYLTQFFTPSFSSTSMNERIAQENRVMKHDFMHLVNRKY